MNNCIYVKKKMNRSFECKKKKKIINIKDCVNCKYKEYKCTKEFKNFTKIKNKSNKLIKLEKERSSLFTDDKNKCMFCGSTYKLTWHEIYAGRNRQNSMKYGLCLRMCLSCHEKYQNDFYFNDYWHKKGQTMFEITYPELEFIRIFSRNYI